MDLQKQFKELHDQFVQALCQGDFEVADANRYVAKAIVDGYKFPLWVANGKVSLSIYSGEESDMNIAFSEAEKECIWKHLDEKAFSVLKAKERKEKEALLKKLQTELNQ